VVDDTLCTIIIFVILFQAYITKSKKTIMNSTNKTPESDDNKKAIWVKPELTVQLSDKGKSIEGKAYFAASEVTTYYGPS